MQPHVIVSAVAFVRDGQVLTVRKHGTGRFMLPGGKWEPGETPAQAAIREVYEELGLRLDSVDLIGEFTAEAANEPDHLVHSTVFRADLPAEPVVGGEIAELRWVGLDQRTDEADHLAPLTRLLLPRLAEPGLATQFREHFGHREHLYGVLLAQLADDLDAGGPTYDICRDRLWSPRGDAVQLRLLGGLHRIVLRGDAPALAPYYAAAGLGGSGAGDSEKAWPHVVPLLKAHAQELRAGLERAPQTNEVGRSACLLLGILEAVRRTGLRRIRLLEPGASAGLNLLVDRFRFTGPGWEFGPTDSPLTIDTGAVGVRPEAFEIVSRRGCDLAPVDVASADGARYLRSFVWPFHRDRGARLAAALEVARRSDGTGAAPVIVDRASAAAWLDEQLTAPAPEGVLTVVWQSITRQYWPAEESAAVEAVVARARNRMPLAHVTMEGVPPRLSAGGYSIAEHGPVTSLDGDPLVRSHHHGPPCVLLPDQKTGFPPVTPSTVPET